MAKGQTPGALIVSRNSETAEGLRLYFERSGVHATVVDRFEWADDDDRFTAVVVFPDEFAVESATANVTRLARRFLRSWIIVVTSQTAHFEQAMAMVDSPNLGRFVVLPRPVWGWALLDRVLQPPSLGATSTFAPQDP